jgi:hypothetical protein
MAYEPAMPAVGDQSAAPSLEGSSLRLSELRSGAYTSGE